jgi:restriction system protein
MTIPDYETLMLPLMKLAGDRKEHSIREYIDELAKEFNLSTEERRRLLSSGKQEIFDNRVGWARTYLKKAGLLDITRRGYSKITERGVKVLGDNPKRIDNTLLFKFEEFREFKSVKREKPMIVKRSDKEEGTPVEEMESSYENIRDNLAGEILQQIKATSPSMFERIVVELIVTMGYGGSLKDAGDAIGGIGDEGIDGIIKEDKLGLDTIYIQAKRWQNVVGRPEIQKFAGALQGKRAKRGIFITTSDYTKEAREYADNIENRIILIDGNQLAELMIDNNVGCISVSTYEVKRIDSDYFI